MQIAHTSKSMPKVDPASRVAIVYSSFYTEETDSMVKTAQKTLMEAGISEQNVLLVEAAGSWEVPLLGMALAESGTVDGMIGLGIIVKGDTHHDALLAAEAARGMMEVQTRHTMPFAFEILHVDRAEHATARATGPHNKGEEAAYALLHSLNALKRIGRPGH